MVSVVGDVPNDSEAHEVTSIINIEDLSAHYSKMLLGVGFACMCS